MIIIRMWEASDKDTLVAKLEGSYSLSEIAIGAVMRTALENPGNIVQITPMIGTGPLVKYEDGKWFLLI